MFLYDYMKNLVFSVHRTSMTSTQHLKPQPHHPCRSTQVRRQNLEKRFRQVEQEVERTEGGEEGPHLQPPKRQNFLHGITKRLAGTHLTNPELLQTRNPVLQKMGSRKRIRPTPDGGGQTVGKRKKTAHRSGQEERCNGSSIFESRSYGP